MNILNVISSRVNRFSLIGSFSYGLLCVFSSTPEILHAIGYVAYFLSAASFFFIMYVLCSVYKVSILSIRHHFFRKLLFFLLILVVIVTSVNLINMMIYNVSYAVAGEYTAMGMYKFFYYIPFLP